MKNSGLKQIREKQFVIVKAVRSPESAGILKRAAGLDQGESEAIILTDEMKADVLLMDEAKGRAVSLQMGIKIMGTIGILMAAYEEGCLMAEEIRKCIDGLQRAGSILAGNIIKCCWTGWVIDLTGNADGQKCQFP